MAFHHIAIATRDAEANHRFYTEAMGFTLVKVEAAGTPEGGWARHLFYDTGDGMIAFWDLHDDKIGDFDPAISTALGLPVWANHLAFAADDRDALERAKQRWLDTGSDVAEIDHGWCTSIYATDPNGIMVEWCLTTRVFDASDRADAEVLRVAATPPLGEVKSPTFFLADGSVVKA
ncbi:MAG: VOC family protein [Actinobacteria bacterium]|nr:VOC family protein [Actinomycetota bacterium]